MTRKTPTSEILPPPLMAYWPIDMMADWHHTMSYGHDDMILRQMNRLLFDWAI